MCSSWKFDKYHQYDKEQKKIEIAKSGLVRMDKMEMFLVKPQDRELLWNINQKYLYEMTNFYDDEMDAQGNLHYGYCHAQPPSDLYRHHARQGSCHFSRRAQGALYRNQENGNRKTRHLSRPPNSGAK